MSDPIEIELASGLNRVLYKKNNDIVKDIDVDHASILFIRKDNKYTPIGSLDEVRKAGIKGKGNCLRTKNGTKIEEIDIMSDEILNIKLFATPPTVGGKRKTRKYKKKYKNKTRKYKKR